MFRLDDPENSRRIVSDISPNLTWTTVFNAPPNADVGAHICIETERYFGQTSPVVCDLIEKNTRLCLSCSLDSISNTRGSSRTSQQFTRCPIR
jgi:hypothetical protein